MTILPPKRIAKYDRVITGEWDGVPIWREMTAGEKLAHRLRDTKLFKGEVSDRSKAYFKSHEHPKNQ